MVRRRCSVGPCHCSAREILLIHTDYREQTCGITELAMHEGLQKEIAIYEKRRPKSAEAHARALKRIPLGVASNHRAYDPDPIFVKEGKCSKIRHIDWNECIDHNLCFAALIAAHGNPASG